MTVIPEPGFRAELGSAARPLLEREGELAAIQAAIEAARAGDGGLVAVEGVAGIGKTRLLSEARPLATQFEVLSARAGELETDFAFGIVRQLFEAALVSAPPEVRDELLSGAAALAAPLFAFRPGEPEPTGGEASFAILHGLYWLAANFGLRQPTLLVIDDLHWADEPSLRWLGYLAKRLEGLPLLVLVATRPPEQARCRALVSEIVADPLANVIRPGALGQASTATLARALFALQPDEVFAHALLDASGGNPLYLAAILDTVSRHQIAPTASEAPRLLELGGEALADAVALRLSRLPDTAVSLVRAAAILGDQTELSLAATLADVHRSAALDASSALVHSDLLERENPVAFRHPVIRSAVLEDMSVGERMRLHRRAAELLLKDGAVPERAATYLVGTLPDADPFVVATLRQAAQRSLAQGAPEAAVAYLSRALREPPEPDARREVLAELGIAESGGLYPLEAAAHLREALAEFDTVAQRPDLVLALAHALLMDASDSREAIALLQQVRSATTTEPELRERIDAFLIISTRYDDQLCPIARGLWDAASARDAAEPILSGILLATGAWEEARRGVSRERAVALARRAATSSTSSLPDRLYLVGCANALAVAGEIDEAASVIDMAIDHDRHQGDRYSVATNLLQRAAFLGTERGELLAAEEDLSAAEVLSISDAPTVLAYRAGWTADVLVPRGDSAEAERLLSTVPLDAVQPGHQNVYLCGRGRMYLETGRPEQALSDFKAAGEIAKSLGNENPAYCPWRSNAALATHRLGRIDDALELAREELELSRRWGAPRMVGLSLRALGLIEGGRAGEEFLREAVEVLAASPARLEHARALTDLGAALRRANRRSEARKHLREGVDMAHKCGATALVNRGNEELAATGAHPRSVMLSGLESLTASERRVAQMAAEEVSNKEIAQALFVTVKTVEMHLSRVYRKLDIDSRRQLAGALSAPAAKTGVTT